LKHLTDPLGSEWSFVCWRRRG